MFDLSGRVALVTGAGQGVGAGIAETLARQGASVVVNDLFEDRAKEVAGRIGSAATVAAFDVTDGDAVRAAFAEVGPVDILVNNAGIPATGFRQVDFKDSDPELWHRFIDLNLFGVMHCTHAALGPMCERGWGRVVTISSEAGRFGLDIRVSLYGAAKAGAIGLMKHVSREVAPSGVTVNCLALGLMGPLSSEWGEKAAKAIPRQRIGTPEDVGATVAFLASDEAEWITGQVIPVNGGSYA